MRIQPSQPTVETYLKVPNDKSESVNCSSGPVLKKKRKENIMGLREDKSSVGLIFLLGLPLNTETPTLEIVTCKLLLLI